MNACIVSLVFVLYREEMFFHWLHVPIIPSCLYKNIDVNLSINNQISNCAQQGNLKRLFW